MDLCEESLSLDAIQRIDAICLRFEQAWKSGNPPTLAAYLEEGDAAFRGALEEQLLALEAYYRGRSPEPAHHTDREDGPLHPLPAAQAPAAPAASERPASARHRFVLTATEGPHRGRTFTFDEHDTFIVGRSKHAHCRLPAKDEYFSRLHFVLEVNPPVCRLMDMGSANGTFVNGHRVKTADLKHGDVIHAGLTVLVATVETEVVSDPEAKTREYAVSPHDPPLAHDDVALEAMPAEESPAPQLGNFQVLRELGRGGMGKVYLALRLSDNSVVALKTILPAVRSGQVAVERFFREAEILRNLQHENIVSFREMGQAEGHLYFAMDFVPGIDAARLLKAEGPLPIARAVNLICQLLDALAFAHERGFVHRDVKPANLMVTSRSGLDTLKVVDFGLARVYHGSKLSGLTITGQIGGTQAFMAPEQITRFREVKPAADQYGTAASLYNLLTGEHVHDFGNSPRDWLSMIVQNDPVPIRTRRPEIPEALARVIHRALAREPAARFADVRSLQGALAPFRG